MFQAAFEIFPLATQPSLSSVQQTALELCLGQHENQLPGPLFQTQREQLCVRHSLPESQIERPLPACCT